MKFQPTSPEKTTVQPEHCDSEGEDHDQLQHEADEYIRELRDSFPHDFQKRIESASNQYDNILFDLKKSRVKRENKEARQVIEECEKWMKHWFETACNWQRELNEENKLLGDKLKKARKEADEAIEEAHIAKEILRQSIEQDDGFNLFRDTDDSPPAKRQRTE